MSAVLTSVNRKDDNLVTTWLSTTSLTFRNNAKTALTYTIRGLHAIINPGIRHLSGLAVDRRHVP